MRMSSVLEIGGLHGYSATNFLQAMEPTQGEWLDGAGSECSLVAAALPRQAQSVAVITRWLWLIVSSHALAAGIMYTVGEAVCNM